MFETRKGLWTGSKWEDGTKPGEFNISYILNFVRKYRLLLSFFLFLIVVMGGGTALYFYFQNVTQMQAHKNFMESLEYYNAPIKTSDSKEDFDFQTKEFFSFEEKWSKVAEVFAKEYSLNKAAVISPAFLLYQSEALWHLDRKDESVRVLEEAIKLMPSVRVADFAKIRFALMKIDLKEEKEAEEGLNILKELALDGNSVAQARALYELGNYYWRQRAFADARNYWNQLVLKYGKSSSKPSHYVDIVKSRLRLINVSSS